MKKAEDRPSLQVFLSLCSCGLPHWNSISPIVYNCELSRIMWQRLYEMGSPVTLLQQDTVMFEMENPLWQVQQYPDLSYLKCRNSSVVLYLGMFEGGQTHCLYMFWRTVGTKQVWISDSLKFMFEKKSKWAWKGGMTAVAPLKPMFLLYYHRDPG